MNLFAPDFGLRSRGLSIFSRCSDGSVNVASYHPPTSATWTWALNVAGQGQNFWRHGLRFRRIAVGQDKWRLELLWLVTVRWATQDATPLP